jgi:uncharacterized RDD family membrane protein YckC
VYCSKCGSAIAAGATFCSLCGQSMHAAASTLAAGVPLAAAPVYAGFWLRFLAYLIDALILGVCCTPILMGVGMTMGVGASLGSIPRGGDPLVWAASAMFGSFVLICILVGLVGGWLYHALLESSEWQATAGKKAIGLTVTDLVGHKISFGRASGRHFGKIVTSLIPLGIGYILAGLTEKKQAIHDMLASCLVLRKD